MGLYDGVLSASLSKGNAQFRVVFLFWHNFPESHEEGKESSAKASPKKGNSVLTRKTVFGRRMV